IGSGDAGDIAEVVDAFQARRVEGHGLGSVSGGDGQAQYGQRTHKTLKHGAASLFKRWAADYAERSDTEYDSFGLSRNGCAIGPSGAELARESVGSATVMLAVTPLSRAGSAPTTSAVVWGYWVNRTPGFARSSTLSSKMSGRA
ncbi:unnamed protein product, partial [Didymodactylos carnosus]